MLEDIDIERYERETWAHYYFLCNYSNKVLRILRSKTAQAITFIPKLRKREAKPLKIIHIESWTGKLFNPDPVRQTTLCTKIFVKSQNLNSGIRSYC